MSKGSFIALVLFLALVGCAGAQYLNYKAYKYLQEHCKNGVEQIAPNVTRSCP